MAPVAKASRAGSVPAADGPWCGRMCSTGIGGLGAGPWDSEAGPDPRLGQSQTPALNIDLRRILRGSSFRLRLGAADAGASTPRLTSWGLVAGTQFHGRDGALDLDGDVLTGTVGVDGEWARWLAGVAVSHSRGDGSYTMAGLWRRLGARATWRQP